MLQPILHLQLGDERVPRLVTTPRRSWRRTVVVGRALCLFESLPCKGVAWHELDGFARIQALRLAPFRRSGCSAAVRGGTLMLWFWDMDDVDAALPAAASAGRVRYVAEPLMLDLPATDGDVALNCHGGSDMLNLKAGAIVRSRWEARPERARIQPPLRARPWATDRIGQPLNQAATSLAIGDLAGAALATASVLAVVGTGMYAAYWGASVRGAQDRLAALEREADAKVAALGNLSSLRRSAADDRRWVEAYGDWSRSLEIDDLLRALERPLTAQTVVIKELEVRGDETRLLLVSVGAELNLPVLVGALAAVPGIEDVRLRQSVSPQQAEFSARTARFRHSPVAAMATTP